MRQIKLEEVALPDINGPTLLILHYKSPQDIQQILAHPSFAYHLGEVRAGKETTSAVIHIMDLPLTLAHNTQHIGDKL